MRDHKVPAEGACKAAETRTCKVVCTASLGAALQDVETHHEMKQLAIELWERNARRNVRK